MRARCWNRTSRAETTVLQTAPIATGSSWRRTTDSARNGRVRSQVRYPLRYEGMEPAASRTRPPGVIQVLYHCYAGMARLTGLNGDL